MTTHMARLLLITLLSGIALSTENSYKPVLVVEIARHGARSPTKANKLNIPWEGPKLGYEFSQLLPSGYRQHYLSGLEKTLTYRQILNKPLEEEEYCITSTSKSRTYQSAFAHFLGFTATSFNMAKKLKLAANSDEVLPPQKLNFDPNELKDLETALPLGLEPPIIHSKSLDDESLIRFHGYKECKDFYKNFTKSITNVKYAEFGKYESVEQTRKELRTFLKKKFGDEFFKGKKVSKELKKLKFQLLAKIADISLAQWRLFGEDSDKFLFKGNMDLFRKLLLINNNKQVSIFSHEGFCRLSSSQFLNHLRSVFWKKAFKKTNIKPDEKYFKELKYLFYSTHDTFMTPLLINLGLMSTKCADNDLKQMRLEGCETKPKVASSLVWELLEKEKGSYYVRSLYNGEYYDLCGNGETDGYYTCAFKDFSMRIAKITISNWKDSCLSFNEKKNRKKKQKQEFFFGFLCRVGLMYGILTLVVIYSFFFMAYFMFKLNMLENQLYTLYERIEKEEKAKESISDEDVDIGKIKKE